MTVLSAREDESLATRRNAWPAITFSPLTAIVRRPCRFGITVPILLLSIEDQAYRAFASPAKRQQNDSDDTGELLPSGRS